MKVGKDVSPGRARALRESKDKIQQERPEPTPQARDTVAEHMRTAEVPRAERGAAPFTITR